MINCERHFFERWHYDDALLWMKDAQRTVLQSDSKIILGCGSPADTTITIGRRGLLSDHGLETLSGYTLRKVERGGGLTAHEPGQIVFYPILSIKRYAIDIKKLIFLLEEAMITFLSDLGIVATRSLLGPGVYVKEEKIGFLGLRICDFVVSHGIAINLLNDAKIFSQFSPCGMADLTVTSARYHAKLNDHILDYVKLLSEHSMHSLSTCL